MALPMPLPEADDRADRQGSPALRGTFLLVISDMHAGLMSISQWGLALLWLVGIAALVAAVLALVWLADPARRGGGVSLAPAGPSGPVSPDEPAAADLPAPDAAGRAARPSED